MFLKDTFLRDSNREAVSEEASGKLCKAPGGWRVGHAQGLFPNQILELKGFQSN